VSLNSFFGKAYCINLDSRPDRWAEAQKELAGCGIVDCERFSAITAEQAGSAEAGCAASHRAIWEAVARGQRGESCLILEDDFMLLTRRMLLDAGYAETSEALRIFDSCKFAHRHTMLPLVPIDWDVLYLGGGYARIPKARVNKHVIRNNGMMTAYSYALSLAGARKLLAFLADEWDPGIKANKILAEWVVRADMALSSWVRSDASVNSYTLSPRLFIQRPGSTSSLNPQPAGFPWSLTDPSHEMMV
jgi:GR25 family glycosyltransferase involved in LPS biosynthesis